MNDIFVDYLHAAVKASRKDRFDKSNQLTLWELILKLEAIEDKTIDVYFDFCDIWPTSLDSRRGSYDEIALWRDADSRKTVEELLTDCKQAIGKEYHGYKWGEYIMSKNTPVWVANPWRSGSTAIVDILDKKHSVYLTTALTEF